VATQKVWWVQFDSAGVFPRSFEQAVLAPFLAVEAPMDVITSLSVYREALIGAIWTLDAFPAELHDFAENERTFLDGVVKNVEADIRFHRDADESKGPTFLIFNRTS